MPMLNPDGYEYSRTTDRLWRKNRRQPPNEGCFGVDLNRNFDVIGFGVGASNESCSDNYLGPFPGSEPEVRAAAGVVLRFKQHIRVSLSLHSFGKTAYSRKLLHLSCLTCRLSRAKMADFMGIYNETRLGPPKVDESRQTRH